MAWKELPFRTLPSSSGTWSRHSGHQPMRIITLNLKVAREFLQKSLIPHSSRLTTILIPTSSTMAFIHTVIITCSSSTLDSEGTWNNFLTSHTQWHSLTWFTGLSLHIPPIALRTYVFHLPFKIPAIPVSFGPLASGETHKIHILYMIYQLPMALE